jgi:prepilin-type N-terminal cleavage/methylation domain-containing protein
MYHNISKQYGFTLIEIIITILIISIFSVMIITFLNTSFTKSGDSIRIIKKTSDINIVMAKIDADYNKYPKWRSGIQYDANSFVVPMIRNGHYYKMTKTGGGISGTIEPVWPVSGTIVDNTCTWSETVENGSLLTLTELKGYISSKTRYETAGLKYNVVYNDFIQLGSGTETSGGNKILKVTITNASCDPVCATLTSLFFSN